MKHAVFAKNSISEVLLEEPSRFAKNGQKVVPTFLLSHPQGFFTHFYKPLARTFSQKVESKNCKFCNFLVWVKFVDHRLKISASLKKSKKMWFFGVFSSWVQIDFRNFDEKTVFFHQFFLKGRQMVCCYLDSFRLSRLKKEWKILKNEWFWSSFLAVNRASGLLHLFH